MKDKLSYYKNIVREVREIMFDNDEEKIKQIEEKEDQYFGPSKKEDMQKKINDSILKNQPIVLKLYQYKGYTDDDLRAIYFYSFIFDRYINLIERGENLDDPKFNYMINEHKELFKFRCNNIKKNPKNILRWYTMSPLIRPFYYHNKMIKIPKIQSKYISNELYKLYHCLKHKDFICPEYLLGEKFYTLKKNEFVDLMIEARKQIISQLFDLSSRLSFYLDQPMFVYRGVALPRENPYLITESKGFTSCTYDYEVAQKFAINEVHYAEHNKGLDLISVILIIYIPPGINIFTTDILTVQYEAEIVITDPVKFIYDKSKTTDYKHDFTKHSFEENDGKSCDCSEIINEDIYEINCTIEKN